MEMKSESVTYYEDGLKCDKKDKNLFSSINHE